MNEFRDCGKGDCFIHRLLLKNYEVMWPQAVESERFQGKYVWSFYVKWKGRRGTHVNKVTVCDEHDQRITEIWSEQVAADIRQEEANDQWLISRNNLM